VITEKVHENDRIAAHTPLLTYCAKSNGCILRVCLRQNECQWSVNDFLSCTSRNENVIWSLLYIIKVLAACIGKRDSDTLTAKYWGWAPTERQQFLVLHLGYSKWCLIADINKQEVGSLYRQTRMRYSCDSLLDNNNLSHFQRCNTVFMGMLTYRTGQNFINRQSQPHPAMINHDARPKVVHTPLTRIVKMGQGACMCFFGWYRRPIHWLCLTTTKSLFNYLIYTTKNCWRSVDAHLQDGAGSELLSRLPIMAANCLIMYNNDQINF